MVRKEYSAGGVKHPFWFLEFKKAAILRDQGVTWEELRTRSREENLFSAASPARAEMTCQFCDAVHVFEKDELEALAASL